MLKHEFTPALYFILALFSTCPFSAPKAAEAAEKAWTVNTTAGVYSAYLFRGKELYDGTSLQPSLSGSYDLKTYGTVNAKLWMHLSGESGEPPKKFTELDGTVSYDFPLTDEVTISAGYVLYAFPHGEGRFDGRDTSEYFTALSLHTLGNPTFSFAHDFDVGEYEFYSLRFNHELMHDSLGEDTRILPFIEIGFASDATDDPVIYKENGLVEIDLGFSAELQLGQFFVIRPNFHFTLGIDDAADNEFWFGVDFGFAV